jgi:hypothetical protein
MRALLEMIAFIEGMGSISNPSQVNFLLLLCKLFGSFYFVESISTLGLSVKFLAFFAPETGA